MAAWLLTIIISYAFIFAINSSIHSFLVVHYAKSDKLAVSVGFYYMANALGRLTGTIGSGLLYTYVGEDYGRYAGPDATAGMAACFFAGTCCSVLAAIITIFINDEDTGLRCGPCVCVQSKTKTEEADEGHAEATEEFRENEAAHLREEEMVKLSERSLESLTLVSWRE